jgi:hypothetical protein
MMNKSLTKMNLPVKKPNPFLLTIKVLAKLLVNGLLGGFSWLWQKEKTRRFSNFWREKALFYARHTVCTPHMPVAKPNDDLERMIYAVNPVYLEISPENEADTGKDDRYWVYLPIVTMPLVALAIWAGVGLLISDRSHLTDFILSMMLLIGFSPYAIGVVLSVWYWIARCHHPVEYLIRFDRKRQKVFCMPRKPFEIDRTPFEDRPILEIPWQNIRLATCQYKYAPIRNAYRGQLLEVDAQEKVIRTIDIIRLASQEYALRPLETIRRYMEEDYNAVIDSIRPKRWRQFCRPDWREMFSWTSVYPSSLDYKDSPFTAGKRLSHLLTVLILPYIFYAYVMNWLMGVLSPAPIWKKSVREMHEADLADLGVDKYGVPVPETPQIQEPFQPKKEAQRLDKTLAVLATIVGFIPLVWFAWIIYIDLTVPNSGIELPGPFTKTYFQMILISAAAAAIAHLSKDLKEKISPNETYWIPATPLPSSKKPDETNQETNASNQ